MSELNTLFSDIPDPDYMLNDDEIMFTIDNDLRITSNGESVLGVVGDANVNNINFKMSKWYNGFDLSTFEIYIAYINASNVGGYYKVSPQEKYFLDDGTIGFAWLVGSKVCETAGTVTFGVKLRKLAGNKITQEFNTRPTTGTVEANIEVAGLTLQSDQGSTGYDQLESYKQYIEDFIDGILDDLEDIPDAVDELETNVNSLLSWKTSHTTAYGNLHDLVDANMENITLTMSDVSTIKGKITGDITNNDIDGLMVDTEGE